MDERNAERARHNLAPVLFGIGLHRGEVLYGNIGAPDRLDFTVIGPAVNHASRIEQLCRTLDRRVLVSAAIAENAGEQLPSLGFQGLRGVRDPQEIFALPDRSETLRRAICHLHSNARLVIRMSVSGKRVPAHPRRSTVAQVTSGARAIPRRAG